MPPPRGTSETPRALLHKRVSRLAFLKTGLLVLAAACAPTPTAPAAGSSATSAAGPALAASPTAAPAASGSLAAVKFTLDFVVGGQHAPWFVAADKGFYKEQGLDVSITPGQGSSAVMQRLAGGDVQLAFADFNGIILSHGQGTAAKAVMCCYQKAPYVVFSLASSNITKPRDLEGKRLVTNPGSPVPQVFRIVAQKEGVDETKITWNTVDGGAKAQLVVSGQADATDYFVLQKPLMEKAAGGKPLNMLALTDYGLVSLSNSVAVLEDFAAKNADTVKRFVAASVKGWEYTFANPDEAVAILVKANPTQDAGLARTTIDLTRGVAVTPTTQDKGLGFMDPAQVKDTLDNIVKAYEVKSPPSVDQIYSNDFLPRK